MASYRGHLKGGIILGLGTFFLAWPHRISSLSATDLVILCICILIGSLLPDIDHPHSVLGRKVPFISVPIHRNFGHRSITHSIFFLLFCIYIPTLLNYEAVGVGLGIGISSHIILDLLCPGSGVAFLYPIYRHRIQIIKKIRWPWKRKKKKRRKKKKSFFR